MTWRLLLEVALEYTNMPLGVRESPSARGSAEAVGLGRKCSARLLSAQLVRIPTSWRRRFGPKRMERGVLRWVLMTLPSRPIGDYMTFQPHTVSVTERLYAAEEMMRELRVRHLPVVDDGTLVGVLSQNDVNLARGLGVQLDETAVGVAMTSGPYVVGPRDELTQVVRRMAEQKVGCVLVQDRDKVVGILTTTDALLLLADAASSSFSVLPASRLPSEVKKRVLDEHEVLRRLVRQVEELAERALREDLADEEELFDAARELYRTLLAHIEMEDTLLAPVLAEAPTYGPQRSRLLERKHHEQREQLQMAMAMLEGGDVEHLSESLLLLGHWVRIDMREEEATMLTNDVLRDEPTQTDVAAG